MGYYVNPETRALDIDPLTAPLVTELFEKYDKGVRISDIQKSFQDRGLKTKKGKDFTAGSLAQILKNRRYIGEYKYDDVIVPGGIPAIIENDLFERVQHKMNANKRAPARFKATEEYLLTTKLFCGDCGRMMVGESGKGSKGTVRCGFGLEIRSLFP